MVRDGLGEWADSQGHESGEGGSEGRLSRRMQVQVEEYINSNGDELCRGADGVSRERRQRREGWRQLAAFVRCWLAAGRQRMAR